MAFIAPIGAGYYGINSEGVTRDDEVNRMIDSAFKLAAKIPASKLNIAFSKPSKSVASRASASSNRTKSRKS